MKREKKTATSKESTKKKSSSKKSAQDSLPKDSRSVVAEIVDPSLSRAQKPVHEVKPDFKTAINEDQDGESVAEPTPLEVAERIEGESWESSLPEQFDSQIDSVIEEEIKRSFKRGSTQAQELEGKVESLPVSKDPVDAYLAEIRKYPLLSREDEQRLARLYIEAGDPKAAETLVTSNLRFVVKIAGEYSKFGARLIDLIQEGNVGLMHAVREFNPYKGVRLITYAVWWIRGYIQDYLMRQYSMVRIGTTQAQRKLFYRLQKERALIEQQGLTPSVPLLSSRLGVTEDDVKLMTERMSGRDVSLQQTVGDDGKSTLLDFEASEEEAVDDKIGRSEMIALLNEGIAEIRETLNERELELLEDRLLADEPLTLQEIGEKYGVTREAVRQMENRLMGKIKLALQKRLTKDAP